MGSVCAQAAKSLRKSFFVLNTGHGIRPVFSFAVRCSTFPLSKCRILGLNAPFGGLTSMLKSAILVVGKKVSFEISRAS